MSLLNFQWLHNTCGIKSKVFTMFYKEIHNLMPIFLTSTPTNYFLLTVFQPHLPSFFFTIPPQDYNYGIRDPIIDNQGSCL